MDQPLIFLDVETAAPTGAPHLIEVGAVRVVAGEAQDHFERLVCPEVPVAPEATEVHGLVVDDLREAGGPADVLGELSEWIGGAWIAAHAARFDAMALGFEYARCGIDPPDVAVLDTLPLAKRCLPEAPDHKLDTLVEHLELDVGPRHRALPDAVATWQVADACIQTLGGWAAVGAADLLDRCGLPLRIADSGPRAPRRQRARVQALERAAREGAEITLVYGEQGEEPSRLPVRPKLVYQLNDRGYLEGECSRSGSIKTYRIDRMQKILS
ncbi:MAG: exonuclease domain-containing protein [Planctomycetota bacterium]